MRIARNILIGLGALLILLTVLAYIGGAKPFPEDKTLEIKYKLAHFIGTNFFGILGIVFLLISYILNKKIKKRKERDMVDSLFKN